jgi:hypothetical protein
MKTHNHSSFSARVEISPFCFGREIHEVREYPVYESREVVPVYYEQPLIGFCRGDNIGIVALFAVVFVIMFCKKTGDKS